MNKMNQEQWQRFSNLLWFENYLEDAKADWLVAQNGYLFRRDSVRLVAHVFDQAKQPAKHFPLQGIEKAIWDKVQLEQETLLFTNEQGETSSVSSAEVPYETVSLRTLFWQDFDTIVQVQSKSLVKVLLILQRKLLNQKVALHAVDVVLDVQRKTLSLVLPHETASYDIELSVEKEGETKKVVYSYLLFRDLLIHANSFQKQITLSIASSYFTKIDYDEMTKAVINHKRKRVEEN